MQLNLSFTAPAQCSQEANERVKESKQTQRQAILEFLQQCGAHGATDCEIQDYLELDGNTVRPRRGELAKMNKIAPNGEKRRNAAGNNCAVWVAM